MNLPGSTWHVSTFAPTHEKVNRVTTIERRSALDSLRATLRSAGYDAGSIRGATSAAEAVGSPALGPAVGRLQVEHADGPLALLVRLFWIAAAEPRDTVERLLPDLDLGGLAEAGVLSLDDGLVRSNLRVEEVFGLLIASDVDHDRDDWVAGVSPSTRLTATHTPRGPADRALDVGCGQGVQALLAAQHCERVVATDLNPRALWMTELNARLNATENIETREGSFLEPVAGERFGLVVVNPPYVVSPAARFLYRDGGLEGDQLSRRLLTEIPRHLEERGFGVLQGNWIHGAGERWFLPIEAGLADSECDALIARISTADPLEYAAAWNEPHHLTDPEGFAEEVRDWITHLRELGVERISVAMVVLRRRPDARNRRRAVTLKGHPTHLAGARLAALFDAQDVASLDADELLDVRLRAPAELRVERSERPGAGQSCVLQLDGALGVRRPVSPELADIVLRLDGGSRLRDAAGDAADLDGVRALVALGFVTPMTEDP